MTKKTLHRIKKITGWFFLCFFVIMIVIAGLIYFRGPIYLNNHLSEFVSKKTKGVYNLQFHQLNLNFSNWGFEIGQVQLTPVDSVIAKLGVADIHKKYYSFSSPKVNINQIQLLKLFLKKELVIGSIEVVEPDLNISGQAASKNLTESNLGSLFKELGPILRKNIRSISVKQIELVDANYDFYNLLGDTAKVSNAEHITIGVQNFYTDSTMLPNPDHLFDADDVFIRLANYENRLSDSLHILGADELYYSLKQSFITGKNVRLQALKDSSLHKNRYSVKVPFLKIKSRYISEFFYSDSIKIDSLFLDKAEIEVYPKQIASPHKRGEISNFDLYTLVMNDFKSVNIGNFLINDANLKLYSYRQKYQLQQELKQLSFEFEHFYLDHQSSEDTTKIFYSNDVKASVGNYKLVLGDNDHSLEANNVSVNTRTQNIQIGGISILPISENKLKINQKIAITVNCDSLKISGANLKQAFHTRKLPLASVDVFRPITTINRYDRGVIKTTNSSSLIYRLVSEYLVAIYANNIKIEKGKLAINTIEGNQKRGFIQSDFNIHLTGFALDSASTNRSDKLFFASDIELFFQNYRMQLIDKLHRLDIDSVHVSSKGQNARISKIHLYANINPDIEQQLKEYQRSELYDVIIPSISLQNTNIHKAFFNKKLTIGNLLIDSPDISFENFANLKQTVDEGANIKEFFDLLSNYIEDVDINQIAATTGKLRVTNHSKKGKTIGFDNQFALRLENFRLNKDQLGKRRLLFSDNMDLKIEKYIFKMADNVHYLQADEISLSTFDSHVSVSNAQFYPDTSNPESEKLPWNIRIKVPSISLTGIDLLSYYYDKLVHADKLIITSPDIRLFKVFDNKQHVDFKQISLPLPDEIKTILIGDFVLNNGNLQFLKEEGSQQQRFLGTTITMKSANLKVENDPNKHIALIKSGMFTTELKNFQLEPINKNLHIEIASVAYSTRSKSIDVKNLLVAPKTMNKQINQFKLFVPSLNLADFNIDRAYLDNNYFFYEIKLDKPEFTFYRNTVDSVQFNPYDAGLSEYFQEFSNEFSANRLSLYSASFELQNKNKTIKQTGIDLSLTSFKVDKNRSAQFLNASQFAFSFKNVVRSDSKNWYHFEFGNISYSSVDKNFIVRDIKLIPQYTQAQFSKMIDHQIDYYKGSLNEIRFSQIDLPRWFEKQELAGSCLLFEGLKLDVFRDKRLNFNESQRPAMPQDLIRKFGMQFYFDSLELKNANVSYAERIEESISEGKIVFNDFKASLKPFTNIHYLIEPSKKTILNVQARMMDIPTISAQISFDMSSMTNQFDVQGRIDTCDLKILNPMVSPAALVEINSGKLQKFEFEFSGDNNEAHGKLKFAYDDLNISILEIKDGSTRKSKFSSFLANSLMLKSKNPRSKILLPDEINCKRDPSRSILNYWWKSIFDGAKNTFGIKDKKE